MGLINLDLLYRTLDAHRVALGLSWRQASILTRISASTYSRMATGQQPGLDAYVEMCHWLGMPMETFAVRRTSTTGGPGMEAEMVQLLDRHEVPAADRDVLLAMVHAYLVNRATPPPIR